MTPLNRNQIAWRAAQDLPEGGYVNLGLGMPVLAANYAPSDREFMFHTENGIVGVGPVAGENEEDPDLVDAGSQKVTLRPGASLADSAMAFAMIRGGHIDVTMLGGFQVSMTGDLANWDAEVPNKGPLVGGRDGLGRWRKVGMDYHGPQYERWRASACKNLHLSSHRCRCGRSNLHRSRHH